MKKIIAIILLLFVLAQIFTAIFFSLVSSQSLKFEHYLEVNNNAPYSVKVDIKNVSFLPDGHGQLREYTREESKIIASKGSVRWSYDNVMTNIVVVNLADLNKVAIISYPLDKEFKPSDIIITDDGSGQPQLKVYSYGSKEYIDSKNKKNL